MSRAAGEARCLSILRHACPDYEYSVRECPPAEFAAPDTGTRRWVADPKDPARIGGRATARTARDLLRQVMDDGRARDLLWRAVEADYVIATTREKM